MRQDLILAPVGALALLTFFVLLLIPLRRFRAAFAGQVGPDDFMYGESARVPPAVSIPNRNYMNLLEVPLLFYVLCIVQLVVSAVTPTGLALAWTYVGLRALHSIVHVTYNDVRHRLVIFGASNLLLMAMWALFYARHFGL